MNSPTKDNPLVKLIDDGNGKAPLNVESALVWTEWLLERLKADTRESDTPAEEKAVWASQKTLAARYDMSMASMGRYLSNARESRSVRILRPEREGKAGNARYNVEDMDAFMSGNEKD